MPSPGSAARHEVPVAAPDTTGWLKFAVGGWLVAYLLASLVGAAALAALGYDTIDDAPLWLLALLYLPLWVGFLGGAIAAVGGPRHVVDRLGLRFRAVDVPLGVGVGVACQLALVPAVSWVWIQVLNLFGKDYRYGDLADEARKLTDRSHGPGSAVLLFLVVAVGAPIVEEIFFRGLLQQSLYRFMPRLVAVVCAGGVFALTHFQTLQFLALWAFGIVLGVLAERTRRLGPGIMAHVAFNATTVIYLLGHSAR